MKFICQLEDLKNEIETAIGFSAQKNSLAITSNVLLDNENDILTIKTTDTKAGFVSQISVQTLIPGSTTVFCDKLSAILKTFSSGEIEISEEDKKLTIRPIEDTVDYSSKINININLKTIPSEKFPFVMKMDEYNAFELPVSDFIDMIDKTSFAVADDQVRIFLTGVYIEKVDGKLAMVATDGRKLAYVLRAFEQEIPDFKGAIVPVKFLNQAKNILSGDGVFKLAISNEHIFIQYNNRYAYSTLILNCEYPNYQKVIPQEFKYVSKVKREDFEKAIALNSVFVESSKSKRLFLDFSEEGVMISVDSNEYGDSKYIIPSEYSGEDMKISFNSSVLITPVKKIDTEFIKICFNTSSTAAVVYPEPEKDYLFVLMPMSL